MKDVAKAAGVCPATVSLALRNHPSIPEKTRTRIRKVAEELGYCPNPRISELMGHIRKTRSVTSTTETVGLIWADARRYIVERRPYLQHFEQAVRQRLRANGYGLSIWYQDEEMKPARLEKILRNRGVRGVLLAPLLKQMEMTLEWDWQNFSAVIAGSARWTPELNRVRFNHFADMRVLIQQLQNKGFSRPGLITIRNLEERSQHAIDGGFWGAVPSKIRKSNAVFELDRQKHTSLPSWIRSYRPDSLILETMPSPQLQEHLPPNLPRFFRSVPTSTSEIQPAGMRQNYALLGEVSVNQLLSQLQQNQQGIPSRPYQSLIPGDWVEPGKRG